MSQTGRIAKRLAGQHRALQTDTVIVVKQGETTDGEDRRKPGPTTRGSRAGCASRKAPNTITRSPERAQKP